MGKNECRDKETGPTITNNKTQPYICISIALHTHRICAYIPKTII